MQSRFYFTVQSHLYFALQRRDIAVQAAVWGTELIQFLADLAVLQ